MRKRLCLEVDSGLRDDIALVAGYANLHARKHLAQPSSEFTAFHDALGRIYAHLDTIDVAESGRPAYLTAADELEHLLDQVGAKREAFQRRQERANPQSPQGTHAAGYLEALRDVLALLERRRAKGERA